MGVFFLGFSFGVLSAAAAAATIAFPLPVGIAILPLQELLFAVWSKKFHHGESVFRESSLTRLQYTERPFDDVGVREFERESCEHVELTRDAATRGSLLVAPLFTA